MVGEPQTRPTCGSNEATCSNGQCISCSKVCDGNFDCTDGSDEQSCSKFLFSGEVFSVQSKKTHKIIFFLSKITKSFKKR